LHDKARLECDDLGYTIGPRLNAAGRLGQAELAIELLTTEDESRAATIAQYMEELNLQRQSMERSMARAAMKQAREYGDPDCLPALVLADHDWHAGVIGIVAGRLAEKYNCPVVMIANDPLGVKPGIGSARSVPGFNLHEALAQCGHLLESHGGHAAAAGLRIAPENVPAFREAFTQVVATEMGTDNRCVELVVDAEASLQMLTRQIVEQIDNLAPFGHGNNRPMFCASDVRLAGGVKRMGATGKHLSMMFDQYGVKMRAVAFGGGDWEEDLARVEGPLSIAFRPVLNHFRGRTTVEIHLADWRVEG
jgi:single-stranded-DNA-specific exonuclease